MPKRIFAAKLENLSQIGAYIVQAALKAGLDDEAVYAVQLAVDEAATNIIEHGYKDVANGKIVCCCEVMDDGIKVELLDRGRQFDPDKIPEPSFDGITLENISPRGLGLYFIRKLMDEVRFDFSTGKGNKLTMVKKKRK